MEVAWGILSFLQSGISTNWFGLACPSHFHPSTWGSLLSSFLLGALRGFAGLAYLLTVVFGFRPYWPAPQSIHPAHLNNSAARLAQYVHEQRTRRQ